MSSTRRSGRRFLFKQTHEKDSTVAYIAFYQKVEQNSVKTITLESADIVINKKIGKLAESQYFMQHDIKKGI